MPPALTPWKDPNRRVGWISTAVVGAFALITRLWGIAYPQPVATRFKIFDEAYYPTEAQELLRYGYEDNRGYLFIVHPPLGKWLIAWNSALHDQAGGLTNPVDWRLAPAIIGTLTVLVTMRMIRRMTRSNFYGALGGGLLALDGLTLVLSRTAILDIFLEFFVIAAFAALVLDRDQLRGRLAGLIADGADLSGGVPSLGPRPWRLAAGVLIGLACAVKWTGLSFLIVFVILHLVWDRGAFKSAGLRRPTRAMWRRGALPAVGSLALVPLGTYLMTYLGWFTGENGWNRHWADENSTSATLHLWKLSVPFTWAWVPGPIRSLGSYTLDAYRFHETLYTPHTYESNPWSWLVLGRPVDFAYSEQNTHCGAARCSQQVLLIGTPLLWWAIPPMLIWLAWHWVTTRDWRAGSIWIAMIAGWLFWFDDVKRTMFLFYMAPLMPFLTLGLTLGVGAVLGPAVRFSGDVEVDGAALRRRRWGTAAVTFWLALVVVDFAWMWPIWTGGLRSYDVWHAHMWLPSWV